MGSTNLLSPSSLLSSDASMSVLGAHLQGLIVGVLLEAARRCSSLDVLFY